MDGADAVSRAVADGNIKQGRAKFLRIANAAKIVRVSYRRSWISIGSLCLFIKELWLFSVKLACVNLPLNEWCSYVTVTYKRGVRTWQVERVSHF